MKFNIKKLSKIFTVFLLIFLTSLEALTFTVSAKHEPKPRLLSNDSNYFYCGDKKYFKNKLGEKIGQYDVKENTPYYVSRRGFNTPVYVTRVFEDPKTFGTVRKIEGINLETEEKGTWQLGHSADLNGYYDVYAMIRADIDEIISCRGISYYKYKRGEAVGEYEVKENTPYIIDFKDPNEEEHDSRNYSFKRIYVQRVFEDPLFWGIFGTERKVEGIDLATGETVSCFISQRMSLNRVYDMIRK